VFFHIAARPAPMPPDAPNFWRRLNAAGCPPPISARQQGIHYTTFCGWRQRRDRGKAAPAFVQVELASPAPPSELVIEMGAARLRLISPAQLPLAARLLQILQEGRPC
jgi:hypothetical protein